MNIYLDVDGVLIDYNSIQMPYLREFVKCVFDIAPNSVYWLTMHCKDGSTKMVLNHLKEILDSDIYSMLESVKPTKWDTLKTEGIDLDSDFIWFDDNVFRGEYDLLESIGKESSLIKVDNNLNEMVEYLRESF